MRDQLTTWKELRADLAALYERLDAANSRAIEAVVSPEEGRRPSVIYVEAFANLRWEVASLRAQAERLLEVVAESDPPAPPARPLEAVLADIEAEGHEYTLYGPRAYDNGPDYALASHLKHHDYRGKSTEEHQQWARDAESGAVKDADPAVAAESRLAQIRELRMAQWLIGLIEGPRLLADLSAVHYAPRSMEVACTAPAEPVWALGHWTEDRDAVTCRQCQDWVGLNLFVRSTPEELLEMLSGPDLLTHPAGDSAQAAVETDYDAVQERAGEEETRA